MASIRQPRSTAAATELCERFAELDGQVAAIEERRQQDIAAINADADRALTDLIAQRNTIAEKLKPWFLKDGKALLEGKRKTMELGGCMVGTKTGKAKVEVAGDEKAVATKLRKLRWARPFIRITVSLDKTAIMKAIAGKRADQFKEHGITRRDGDEEFILCRAEQQGTRG